ncbi:hypothetical protein EDC01DRAFT_632878 [Geopyxis carbonaria]|nr:hypothetical protein EDC01DRAFT_632878 [Geopyxis carbonaria]
MAGPDMIVGIDFGTSETGGYSYPSIGVAYWRKGELGTEVFSKWPQNTDETPGKVPTWLMYEKTPSERLLWGFSCKMHKLQQKCPFCLQSPLPTQTTIERRWFKTVFDLDRLAKMPKPPMVPHEVDKAVSDFLKAIYGCVKINFEQFGFDWKSAEIEFIFSIPTIWENPLIVGRFRKLIKGAGFGRGGSGHSVTIGLTEPSAVAIYTMTNKTSRYGDVLGSTLNIKDSILVCDAGGGTTSLFPSKVAFSQSLSEISLLTEALQGIIAGSIDIDRGFEEHIKNVPVLHDGWRELLEFHASLMSQSLRFQICKHRFGDARIVTECATIPTSCKRCIPGHDGDGNFHLQYSNLRMMFDNVIHKIINLLEFQVSELGRLHGRSKSITHIFLSGGLGSNGYFKQRIEHWQKNSRHRQVSGLALITVPDDPHLAVARGLVLDRILSLTSGKMSIKQRCTMNYGVLYQKSDARRRRIQRKPEINTGSIDWIIKRQESINYTKGDLIESPITRSRMPTDTEVWRITILKSKLEGILPSIISEPLTYMDKEQQVGLSLAGYIDVEFHAWEFEEKLPEISRQSRFHLQTPEYRIAYEVKVFLGAADLKFEVWHKGRKYGETRRLEAPMDTLAGHETRSSR